MTRYTLTYGTIVKVLENAPEGWSDATTSIIRNEKYHGLFRQVTANMRFVGDGADILRYAYYTDGADADVYLKIESRNPLSMSYDVILEAGEIDFTEAVDDRDYFEVPVIDGGLSAKVKANENVKYSLETPPDTVLQYTGVRLYAGSTVQQMTLYNLDPDYDNRYFTEYTSRNYSIPESIVSNTDASQGGYTLGENIPPPPLTTSLGPILTANRYCSIDVDISAADVGMLTKLYEDDYNGGTEQDRWYFRAYLTSFKSDGTVKNATFIKEFSVIPTQKVSQWYMNSVGGSLSYSTTGIKLDPGDYLQLGFGWDVTDPAQQAVLNTAALFVSGLNIEMSVESVLPTVQIRAYTAKELFAALIDKMSPGTPVKSTYLDGLGTDEIPLYLSGDAIRQISPYYLKVTFSDFFDSMAALFDVGFGIEIIGGVETAVLEQRSYFYDSSPITNIGEVSELRISAAPEMMAKTISAGYQTKEYKELNGRDEFNAVQNWVTGYKRINTEVDLKSPIRADMYGIDNLRISYTGNTSTDTTSDNDVFIVDSEFVGTSLGVDYYQVSRDKVTNISGLINADTAYNLNLSPKRCLLRRSSLLASMCFKQTSPITLSSGDKNIEVVSTIDGLTVSEKTDISIASLGTALYYPIIFDITLAQQTAAWVALLASGNSVLSFSYRGNDFYGYIKEAGVNIDHRAVITMQLICSSLTDLTKLI